LNSVQTPSAGFAGGKGIFAERFFNGDFSGWRLLRLARAPAEVLVKQHFAGGGRLGASWSISRPFGLVRGAQGFYKSPGVFMWGRNLGPRWAKRRVAA